MAKRKEIPKKIRFEVFKRDKFTCQYCGRMAPDVILEVDHINPVAAGGDNELLNLVTSCRDCNRGKGKTLLSDDAAVKVQQKQLLDLADKAEQAQMMIDWKNELLDIRERQCESINNLIISLTGYELNKSGMNDIKAYLIDFTFAEVWDAVEIAFTKYFEDSLGDEITRESFCNALRKVGGICYNKRKGGE
jgi:hypothetical protein